METVSYMASTLKIPDGVVNDKFYAATERNWSPQWHGNQKGVGVKTYQGFISQRLLDHVHNWTSEEVGAVNVTQKDDLNALAGDSCFKKMSASLLQTWPKLVQGVYIKLH